MILVTGVSGFVGKHLLSDLQKEFGVKNVLALTSKPIENGKYLLHNNYTFDENYFIDSGFKEIKTIIHAGAFTPKSGSEANDVSGCNSNIVNTTVLLNSRFPNLEKFIFLSTLDVYQPNRLIDEESVVEPISLYGYSKLYCEKLIKEWAIKRKVISQTLRIGHVYGPGEELYLKIIPATMWRLIKSEPIQLYGDGKSIRTFIYISDVVDAIIHSLRLSISESPINIVGEKQVDIISLIEKIIKISKLNPELEQLNPDVPNRDMMFNNQKMKELLIVPKISLELGLNKEWEYFKKLTI